MNAAVVKPSLRKCCDASCTESGTLFVSVFAWCVVGKRPVSTVAVDGIVQFSWAKARSNTVASAAVRTI